MNFKVNWGAIFAGSFIGLAAFVFFSLFALAAGISGVNVVIPFSSTISVFGAIYTVATSVAAFLLAGYCTVRLAHLRDPGIACLHALSSFALAGVLAPVLFTRNFPAGPFFSTGLAWTLFFAYGFSCVAASAGGVWATTRRARGVGSASIEPSQRGESWPAA